MGGLLTEQPADCLNTEQWTLFERSLEASVCEDLRRTGMMSIKHLGSRLDMQRHHVCGCVPCPADHLLQQKIPSGWKVTVFAGRCSALSPQKCP